MDRFYIGETVHGSAYVIDRTSHHPPLGRSGSFVVVIDSGEASWVCGALNEKHERECAPEPPTPGEKP